MGRLIAVHPDGKHVEYPSKKADYEKLSGLVGGYIERIKVRYEGKVRDCYLNEEGLLNRLPWNPKVKEYAEAYYNRPCQQFAGVGVIWIPS